MSDHRGKDTDAFAYAAFLDALGAGDTSQAAFEQAAEADLGSVLQQLQTGPVQPTSTTPTATNEQLEQERQTLIDMIREAGGNVGPAVVEGIADLGNLVTQAITLGKGPQLDAVIPNIMDIIRGGIGGKLVLGPSGNQQNTVIGTGQTGLGRGTRVAVGGIFGTIANIFKQGGNLGTVISQFPNILIDNLPGVISAAAAAGYAFNDNDKETLVKMGLEPSILDGIGDDKTVATSGDDTLPGDAVDVLTTPDTTPVVGASTVDELPPVIRTGLPDAETPAITRTGLPLAEKSAVVRTPLPDSEIEKILTDLGGLPAVAGGYDTPAPEIKTAAELTSSPSPAGGGGGSGSTQIGGTRTVTVEPGPLVDIPGLYDISSDSIIPEYLGELIKRSQRQRAAEGGHVKKFKNGGSPGDFESLAPIYGGAPSGVRGKLGQFVSDNAPALLTSALGGLFGLLDDDDQQPAGYQGGIPDYTAQRSLLPNAFDQTDRRPGSMGRRYFTDTRFVPTGETQGILQGVGVPAPAVAATTPELNTEAFAASTPADTSADAIDVLTGAQPAAQPVAQPATQPVAQPATQPATQPVVVQPPPPPPPTPYEAIPVDGEYTSGERDIVAEAIASGETTIPKAAGRFGVSTGDVIEELLRGNYQTPEQVIESLGYTGGVPGLIVELAAQGRTNPQEIVDYFGNNPAYPEYKNITVEEVTDYLRRAQVPGYREGGRLLFDDMGKSSDNPQFNPMSTTLSNRPTMGPPEKPEETPEKENSFLDKITSFVKDTIVDPDLSRRQFNLRGTGFAMFNNLSDRQKRLVPFLQSAIDDGRITQEEALDVIFGEKSVKDLPPPKYAQGGIASLGGPNYLAGATDGMADLVPATIGGSQPAALSDGEFVIPADVVSHLGNGNSDAGAKELYAMMDRVRDERTGTTRQGPEINPMNMMPA